MEGNGDLSSKYKTESLVSQAKMVVFKTHRQRPSESFGCSCHTHPHEPEIKSPRLPRRGGGGFLPLSVPSLETVLLMTKIHRAFFFAFKV